MSALGYPLSIGVPLLLGFVATCLLYRTERPPWLERLAVAYGLGTGLLTALLLLLGLAGLPLTLSTALGSAGLVILLMSALLYRSGWRPRVGVFGWRALRRLWRTTEMPTSWRPQVLLELALVVGLFVRVAFAFQEALLRPVLAWDVFTYWGLYAKMFFLDQRLALDAGSRVAAAGDVASHPLNVPLLGAWVYMAFGVWRDDLLAWPFPFFYCALLALAYATLRPSLNRLWSLLFTYLIASLPLLAAHAATPQGELPLTFYATASGVFFWRWLRSRRPHLLIIGACFAALAIWTKSAGLILVACMLVLLVPMAVIREGRSARKRLVLTGVSSALPIVAAAAIWIPLRGFPQIVVNLDVIPPLLSSLFLQGSFSLLWAAFVAVSVLFMRTLRSARYAYLPGIVWLCTLGFAAVYVLVPGYHANALNGTVVSRNTLSFAPLAVLSIAVLMGSRRGPDRRRAVSQTGVPRRGGDIASPGRSAGSADISAVSRMPIVTPDDHSQGNQQADRP